MAASDLRSLLSANYPTRMLGVASLGWATIQFGRFVLPPFVDSIESSLGMSSFEVGLAFTAFTLIYAVTQYPSGAYSDAIGRATLIVPGFLAIVVGFVLLGFSTTVAVFWVAMVVFGLGKGLYTPPTRALLGDLFTARRGRALGIYSAGTDVGGLIGSGVAFVVLGSAVLVWQSVFFPLAVILALATALFVAWNREPYESRRVAMTPAATAKRLLATPAQRNLLVAYALFFFVVGGLITFLPKLFIENGFSESVSAVIYALLFAVGLVIKPAAGELSDRFPRLAVSIAMIVLSASGIGLLLVFDSFLAMVVGTIVTAAGYKTQFPITDAVIMEAAPSENMGGDLGAARAVFLGANSVGPAFVGFVAEYASFAAAFAGLAVGLLLSAGMLALEFRRE